MRLTRSCLLATCLLAASCLPGLAAGLSVSPASVAQGGALLVTFEPVQPVTQAEARWQNRRWPLVLDGGLYRGSLPVNYDVPVGTGVVAVRGTLADGAPFYAKAAVTVTRTKFTVQYLRLSKQQEGLYDYPGVQAEYDAIHAALAELTPAAAWPQPFMRPLPGGVSTSYGLKRYVNGTNPYRHKGVDLRGAAGTPIRAAAAGTVTLARPDFKLHGQTVILDHGLGLSTLYLHMSKIVVKPGQQVQAGDTIGLVGSTGVATGPHLHWGVYVQGTAVNPLWWLRE